MEGFKEQLELWWMSNNFRGLFSFILACKLKALKRDLKVWNKKVFGKELLGNKKF